MSEQIKLYVIQDSYSFHPEYDITALVYEDGDLVRLLDSKNSTSINVENFIGGGESVSFELVAYKGDGVVFVSYMKITNDGVKLTYNYTIISENELSDELKTFIKSQCTGALIEFKLGELTVDKKDFFEDVNEYKGNELLYGRISKNDVDELIKSLEEK